MNSHLALAVVTVLILVLIGVAAYLVLEATRL